MTTLHFKSNIKAEPTINYWYAWASLVSPMSFPVLALYQHAPILESYVDSAELHAVAVGETNTLGGPFLDAQGKDRREKAKKIFDSTNLLLKEQYNFAKGIRALSALLTKQALGGSLETFYQLLPAALRGCVELYYDLNNRPGFRVFESLLYQTNYYQKNLQRVFLSGVNNDKRPFALSTPFFKEEKHVVIEQPFNAALYDELFSARSNGLSIKELELIAKRYIPEAQQKSFFQLFTEEKPSKTSKKYLDGGVRVRYFGHACLLIETRDVTILVDPLISYDYPGMSPRLSLSDLPDNINYVLITHAHQDHFVIETLLQIRHKVKNIVVPKNNKENFADPSLKLVCHAIGFKNCIEIDEFDFIHCGDGSILGIPFLGEHGDLNIHSKMAYIINLCGKHILCAADSNNLDIALYQRVQRLVPKIDVAFLGMECAGAPFSWLYGPFFLEKITREMDRSRRLDGSDASKAYSIIEAFACPEVYIYAMGQEPWLKFICSIEYSETSKPIIESDGLIQHCQQQGIKAKRLYGHEDIKIGPC